MKFGAILVIYAMGIVLAAVHRLGNVLIGLGIAILGFGLIGIVGWLFRWDKTVSFSIRWEKRLFTIIIMWLVAMFTWKYVFSLIFN